MDPKDILNLTPEMEKKICELIRSNRITEAAEMYCIRKDCGLEEAQEGIREIASRHGLTIQKQKKIGCAAVILILVSVATVVIYLALYVMDHFNL